MKKPLHRDEDGTLPAYAWPGGYPIVYYLTDLACLCPACANGGNGSKASETSDDEQWRIVAQDIFYEGAPEACDHCGELMESAYGDSDDADNA